MTERSIAACLSRIAAGRPATDATPDIHAYLTSAKNSMSAVIATDGKAIALDLGAGSQLYGEKLRGISVALLSVLIDRAMSDAGTGFAFGRYAEPRDLYHTDLFAGGAAAERRDLHLGIDVFCRAGTDICSPLDGVVEIVANNTAELDYGPLLILRHETDRGMPFFILHGHLASATAAKVGDRVSAGDKIGKVGSPPVNGNWPPHLHIQVITDLLGLGADFPGVAYQSQQQLWMQLSPNPAVFFPDYAHLHLNAAEGRPAQ